MPYKNVKFKVEHLKDFNVREEQKPEMEFFLNHPDIQKFWMYKLPILTLLHNDVPILIYGLQNTGIGTYFPMVFAGKDIDKHRFAVIRCLYDYVEKFVGTDVRRFEGYVAATDKKARRLAEFFGFEPVGIRRQAGVNGEDQIIYERLWRK